MPMTDDKKPSDSTQDIKNRIQDFKDIHEDTTPKTPQNQGMGVGLRMATDMVAGVLVGLFVGYNLDSWLNTKPLFLLIFLIIGMVAGLLNVIRTAHRLDNMQKKGTMYKKKTQK